MGDSFISSLFKQSYQRVFEKDSSGFLKMSFNATLEVILFGVIIVSCSSQFNFH